MPGKILAFVAANVRSLILSFAILWEGKGSERDSRRLLQNIDFKNGLLPLRIKRSSDDETLLDVGVP